MSDERLERRNLLRSLWSRLDCLRRYLQWQFCSTTVIQRLIFLTSSIHENPVNFVTHHRPTLRTFSLENVHYYSCPELEKSAPKQLNDLRPVALTLLVTKTLEKTVKSFILSAVQPMLGPLQCAHRAGRGVEDIKLFLWGKLCKHLELPQSHARMPFVDVSSAFNKCCNLYFNSGVDFNFLSSA